MQLKLVLYCHQDTFSEIVINQARAFSEETRDIVVCNSLVTITSHSKHNKLQYKAVEISTMWGNSSCAA